MYCYKTTTTITYLVILLHRVLPNPFLLILQELTLHWLLTDRT